MIFKINIIKKVYDKSLNKEFSIRLAIFIFLIVSILFSILFTWNDKLTLTANVDIDKIAKYFSVISCFATLLTIVVLNSQIEQMKTSSKLANQPDLQPIDANFIVEDIQELIFSKSDNLDMVKTWQKNLHNSNNKEEPHIELHNIGIGAAKNITIKWDYNVNIVKEFIKDIYSQNIQDNCENEHINFVSRNNKCLCIIPYNYMNACGIKLNQNLISRLSNVENNLKPPLKLLVKYQDTYGTTYNKVFPVTINSYLASVTFKFQNN